jgi:hypothetical protein
MLKKSNMIIIGKKSNNNIIGKRGGHSSHKSAVEKQFNNMYNMKSPLEK